MLKYLKEVANIITPAAFCPTTETNKSEMSS